jgi:two-component system response regulator RegA
MTDPTTTPGPQDGAAPQSILIVDDDEIFRERLARSFRTRGFDVRTAGTVEAALGLAREDSPELAVLDLRMPGGSGVDLLRGLKQIDPSTKVLILSGYGSIATAVEAVKLGAENFIPKPADADDILAAFEKGSAPGEAVQTRYQAPSLARAEWEHIQRVLADCAGNISEAARRLGIHRRSLQRKLNKYAPR